MFSSISGDDLPPAPVDVVEEVEGRRAPLKGREESELEDQAPALEIRSGDDLHFLAGAPRPRPRDLDLGPPPGLPPLPRPLFC